MSSRSASPAFSEVMHPQDELWQAVLENDTFDANAILREEPEAQINFRYIDSLLAVRKGSEVLWEDG